MRVGFRGYGAKESPRANAPADATFAQDGSFGWTPSWSDAGLRLLTLSATDPSGLVATRIITLDVRFIDVDEDDVADTWELEAGLDPDSRDSDGDTISDADELGDDLTHPSNVDQDELIDALDLDSDNDGVPDADEAGDSDLATAPLDSDEDGIADFRQASELVEAGPEEDSAEVVEATEVVELEADIVESGPDVGELEADADDGAETAEPEPDTTPTDIVEATDASEPESVNRGANSGCNGAPGGLALALSGLVFVVGFRRRRG